MGEFGKIKLGIHTETHQKVYDTGGTLYYWYILIFPLSAFSWLGGYQGYQEEK
jgi:hypothetical protein